MIKAVIFDMDGLLIDSEPFWRAAQRKTFKTVNIEPSDYDMEYTMGRRIDEVVEHWYHHKPWEGASLKDIEALIVDDVIDQIKSEGVLLPGVHDAFELCKSKGLPMAIASSSPNELINAVVESLDLEKYFDLIYSAEHEQFGKPHPGVFITTAEKLGVTPHSVLVFEDSPSGVLAAKAAKMQCVAVPNSSVKNHPFIQTADLVIDSLEQFDQTALDKLNQI